MNFSLSRLLKLTFFCVLMPLLCPACAECADAKSPSKQPDLTSCGGNDLAAYIGKSVDALRQRSPADARFVCERDCAMIMDVRPSRLTVIYSKRTNTVVRMFCG